MKIGLFQRNAAVTGLTPVVPILPSKWGMPVFDRGLRAFTLVEVMVTIALTMVLIIVVMFSIMSMGTRTSRLADSTAAMVVVQAKVEDIRAASYNPGSGTFSPSTVYITNSKSIALNKAGATFLVSGTLVSEIKPIGSGSNTLGHLVTVTGTFQTPRKPITVSLQTVVNKYSCGQQ